MASRCLATSAIVLHLCALSGGVKLPLPRDAGSPGSEWDPSQIAVVRQTMMEHASDVQAQIQGCQKLQWIASHNRGGPGPFPGSPRRADPRYIQAGIGEAFALGALNSAANTVAPEQEINSAVGQCSGCIAGLDVQYDRPKELLLLKTTPHLWDAIMEAARRGVIHTCIFAGLVGGIEESIDSLAEAGGFDWMFEKLQNSTTDDELFQAALCSLSDNVQGSRKAAEYIANTGGRNHGIEVFVKLMPLTLGRHFQEGNGFGLQYEMVHDTTGLLRHDDKDHTWRKEFYRLGYLQQLLAIMADDPTDNHLQDNCCQAIYFMTEGNATVQSELAEAGAMELMATAIKTFAPKKLTGYCTVTHSCSTALLTFARANPSWLADIRRLGVGEALTLGVLSFNMPRTSGTPGMQYFPSTNIFKLKQLLS